MNKQAYAKRKAEEAKEVGKVQRAVIHNSTSMRLFCV